VRTGRVVLSLALIAVSLSAITVVAYAILTPDPVRPYRETMRAAGYDFDAVVTTLQNSTGSDDAVLAVRFGRVQLPATTIDALERTAKDLPEIGVTSGARAHYVEAISNLRAAVAVFRATATSPMDTRLRVRDYVARANAEWRKGDDLLR